MSEIWNLNALCRCCHKDGYFRSMQYPYVSTEGGVEMYADWLKDTFGITMSSASVPASTMICEECTERLSDARAFKLQVVRCELKFQQYCMNEEAVKMEYDDGETIEEKPPVYEFEAKIIKQEKKEVSDGDDTHWNNDNFDANDEDMAPQEDKVTPSSSAIGKKVAKRKKTTVVAKKAQKRTRQNVSVASKKLATEVKSEKKIRPKSEKIVKEEFKCLKCAAVFNSEYLLMQHKSDLHGYVFRYTPRKCEVCRKTYSVHSFTKHMRVEHPEEWKATTPVKCEQCGSEQYDDEALKEHVAFRHTRIHRCEACGITFDQACKLRSHINSHHLKVKLICDFCGKEFTSRHVLIKHINVHMGKNSPAACPQCGHVFRDLSNLTKHVRTVHQNIRAFNCELCPNTYKAKKALLLHLAKKHTETLKYKCDKCTHAYTTEKELIRHNSYHLLRSEVKTEEKHTKIKTEKPKPKADPAWRKERQFRCAICSFVCRGLGAYRKHLNKVHRGQLPYSCHICGRAFATKYAVERHILSHNETRDSVCDICQKAFKHEVFLTAHRKRTHGMKYRDGTWKMAKKDYVKCAICKLMVHDIEQHTERHYNRPHKCTQCDKAYAHKNALNRHVKEVHLREYRFQCDLCSLRFVKSSTVYKHKMKRHAEEFNGGNKPVKMEKTPSNV